MKAQDLHDALGHVHPQAEISLPAEAVRDLLSQVPPDFNISEREGNAIHGIYTLDDMVSLNY